MYIQYALILYVCFVSINTYYNGTNVCTHYLAMCVNGVLLVQVSVSVSNVTY